MAAETPHPSITLPPASLGRIAVGIDPSDEARDAVVLASRLVEATHGDLLLLAVEPELPLMLPGGDWRRMRRETEALLARLRADTGVSARTAIDTDLSTARGIRRLARREHRELLVIGSCAEAAEGQVMVGATGRQLLDRLGHPLAIAPGGLSDGSFALRRIGVGFDGGTESLAALSAAIELARGSGAELVVHGVIDDRVPALGWPQVWIGSILEAWREVMDDEAESLRRQMQAAVAEAGVAAIVEVARGRSGESLLELSEQLDLLVIGSRRWGPVAHLLLGGTGEALVRGSRCAMMIVPRPD